MNLHSRTIFSYWSLSSGKGVSIPTEGFSSPLDTSSLVGAVHLKGHSGHHWNTDSRIYCFTCQNIVHHWNQFRFNCIARKCDIFTGNHGTFGGDCTNELYWLKMGKVHAFSKWKFGWFRHHSGQWEVLLLVLLSREIVHQRLQSPFGVKTSSSSRHSCKQSCKFLHLLIM